MIQRNAAQLDAHGRGAGRRGARTRRGFERGTADAYAIAADGGARRVRERCGRARARAVGRRRRSRRARRRRRRARRAHPRSRSRERLPLRRGTVDRRRDRARRTASCGSRSPTTARASPTDERERIFEPGFRGARRTGRDDDGAGLGLSLARRLARSVSGDVAVLDADREAASSSRFRARDGRSGGVQAPVGGAGQPATVTGQKWRRGRNRGPRRPLDARRRGCAAAFIASGSRRCLGAVAHGRRSAPVRTAANDTMQRRGASLPRRTPSASHVPSRLAELPWRRSPRRVQDAAAVALDGGRIDAARRPDREPTSRWTTSCSPGRGEPRRWAVSLTALHDSAGGADRRDRSTCSAADDAGTQSDAIVRVADRRRDARRSSGACRRRAPTRRPPSIGGTAYVVGGYTGTRWLDTIVAWRPGARGARRRAPAVAAPLRGRRRGAGTARDRGRLARRRHRERGGARVHAPGAPASCAIGRLPAPTTHAAAAALGGVGLRDRRPRRRASNTPTARDRRDRPAHAARSGAAGALATPRSDLAAVATAARSSSPAGTRRPGHDRDAQRRSPRQPACARRGGDPTRRVRARRRGHADRRGAPRAAARLRAEQRAATRST